MVQNVGRVQEDGAGQGQLKLMARPLAARCVTTSGHLDALAIVLLFRSCTTVRGESTVIQRTRNGWVNSLDAQPCDLVCHRLRVIKRIG